MTKTTIELLRAERNELYEAMADATRRIKNYTERIEDFKKEIVSNNKLIDECNAKIAHITQDLG